MSKSVKTDHDFDDKLFTKLLIEAKGGRSQTQFAKDCGLSVAYMCKCLNGNYKNPPIPSTIKKIADQAANNISLSDLLNAAGYDYEKYHGLDSNNESTVRKTYKKAALACITSALSSLKFSWFTLSNDHSFGNDFGISTDSDTVRCWYFEFIPLDIDESTAPIFHRLRKETRKRLEAYYFSFFVNDLRHSKYSFVTSSRRVFNMIEDYPPCLLAAYVSVILIDIDNLEVIEERYLKSYLDMSDELYIYSFID